MRGRAEGWRVMAVGEEDWLSIVDAFNAAALKQGSWLDALAGLAAATGSRSGRLIAFGSSAVSQFNWLTEVDPAWLEALVAAGGTDPSCNPRLAAGAGGCPQQSAGSSAVTPAPAGGLWTHARGSGGSAANGERAPTGSDRCCPERERRYRALADPHNLLQAQRASADRTCCATAGACLYLGRAQPSRACPEAPATRRA